MSGLKIYGVLLFSLFVILIFAFQFVLIGWRSHGFIRGFITRLPLIGPAARDGEAAVWRAASLAAGAGLMQASLFHSVVR